MDKIIDYLKQLDLSDVEAKLYLTLLKTGPTSVRELAETVDIKRTTAYFYIDLLTERGLIMKLVKGSKKLIAANDPENLKALVEAKLKSAKEVQTRFPDILKTLSTLPKDTGSTDAEIRYYKGKNGVVKIYEEALKSHELRSFFNIELIKEALPENEELFIQALKKNKDIKIYELFQDTPVARHKLENREFILDKKYFYKFLPPKVSLSAADTLIYDGNVAIIDVRNQLNGVILKNSAYYNNSKELFDLIWNISPN